MKTLIVAEKPSVAREYKAALEKKLGKFTLGSSQQRYFENDTHIITWARGHLLRSLEPRDYEAFITRPNKGWNLNAIPFYPPNGDLDYVTGKDTEADFKQVASIMKRKDIGTFINGCDAGREGELIFWEMYDVLKLKQPVKRLWCKSMTEKAILDAYNDLKDEAFSFTRRDAAYARAYADWMLGMNLTIGFSVKANMGKALTFGRVQTPTVAILVQRKLEIDNFKPEDYFEIEAEFGGKYKGMWFKNQLSNTKFDAKADAEAIVNKIKGKKGIITKKDVKEEQQPHPFLYSLTTLQQDANRRYGFTAVQTLNIAQSLYETHKILSYPRSDSQYLGSDMVPQLQTILNAVNVSNYTPFVSNIATRGIKTSKRFIDDSKLTDHHAVVPTEKTPNLSALSPDELKIYDLVVKRFLSVFYPNAKYEKTEIVTTIEGETFKTSGKIEMDPGWKVVYGTEADTDDDDKKGDKEEKLPIIHLNEEHALSAHKLHAKKTKPPKHYTDDDLLKAMDKPKKFLADKELQEVLAETEAGLGTPATRAAHIENIIAKGYVERQKKNLVATDLGVKLIEVSPEELKSPEITADWEQKLNYIQEAKLTKDQFKQEIHTFIERNIDNLRTSELSVSFKRAEEGTVVGVCPECGGNVLERSFKMKDKTTGKPKDMKVYACTSASKESPCFTVYGEINGKKIPLKNIKQLIQKRKTDEIPGFKSKTGKTFAARLVFEEKKVSFDFPKQINEATSIPCPICQQHMMDKGNSLSCEAGHLTVYKTIASKTLTLAELEALLTKGETPVLEGFVSKTKKKFAAALKLTDGKVEFDFSNAASVEKSSGITCPICAKGTLNERDWGYGCSNYKEGCKFTISKEMFGKKLTMPIIKEVIEKKKTTKKVEGFVSKAGKSYSAFLVLDEKEKKVKISFE